MRIKTYYFKMFLDLLEEYSGKFPDNRVSISGMRDEVLARWDAKDRKVIPHLKKEEFEVFRDLLEEASLTEEKLDKLCVNKDEKYGWRKESLYNLVKRKYSIALEDILNIGNKYYNYGKRG